MDSYYENGPVALFHGDCVEVMKALPDESVHAVVTDPPYGLDFMGKAWDKYTPGDFQHWCEVWARECLRVLKPGGHLLAFGGSRTWHRLAAGIEDAGFEVRDSIAWLYGSGFPKSLDVSKAIDKAAGAEREVTGRTVTPFRVDAAASRGTSLQGSVNGDFSKQTEGGYRYTEHTAPATADAERWQGWGTALKPAFEPIVVARKPLVGTVAANVLAHGVGALNIDAARVGSSGGTRRDGKADKPNSAGWQNMKGHGIAELDAGRWPSNVVLDESQAAELDEQSGGASRFFPTFRYQAKAPTRERPRDGDTAHPTVKPLSLMRWLVKLVTPPGGTILEPFAGSGTTLEAAVLEGFDVVGIESEATYLPLIMQRVKRSHGQVLADG